jgi:hypothetical protein
MNTPDITMPKPSRTKQERLILVLFFGIIIAHSIQLTRLYPSIRSIFDSQTPLLLVDHAIHEYHGSLGAQFLMQSGRTWGYDPYFMAGYPETPIWDSSSNASILFNLIGWGQGFRGYKVGVWLFSLMLVPAIAGAARLLGLSMAEVTVTTFFGAVFFWIGFPNVLWRTGLFSFTTVAACSGLLLALCVRYHQKPSRRAWILLGLVGAALFFVHITAPIILMGGLLPFYLIFGRKHDKRWHAGIWLAIAITVLINLIWLVPFWNFRDIRNGDPTYLLSRDPLFIFAFFLNPDEESRYAFVLLILGTLGLIRWARYGLATEAIAFGGAIYSLILLTGFGSFWGPTRALEPVRFSIVFLMFLTIPAGSCLVAISRFATSRFRSKPMRFGIALGVWLGLFAVWALQEPKVFARLKFRLTQDHPLVVGYQPEMMDLISWIKSNTQISARILFEDQLRLLERTDPESTHWTPLLPNLLGDDPRLFIGGVYHSAFIKHNNTANFGDFELGSNPINSWSTSGLNNYFYEYNIGWIIAWSPLSRFWFDRIPNLERVATIPRYSTPQRPISQNEHEWKTMINVASFDSAKKYMTEGEHHYAIYRVNRPHSYFIQGKGRLVSARPDRLEFADIEPDNGAAVVSFHWLDSFRTDPIVKISAQKTPFDPVDFIRIESSGPIPSLVITNGPGK